MPYRIRPLLPNLGRDSVHAASLVRPPEGSEQVLEAQTAGDGRSRAAGAVETGRPPAPARGGITSGSEHAQVSSRAKAKIGGVSVLLSGPICRSGNPALRVPESGGGSGTVERTAGAPAGDSFAEKLFTGLAIIGFLALAIWG